MLGCSYPKNFRALSLGILCFEGFGIRIFDGVFNGAIVLWTIVLFCLNIRYIVKMSNIYWLKVVCVFVFYIVFCQIKDVAPATWLCAAWLSAAICIAPYISDASLSFVDDIRKLAKFCMYYSLLHIPIMLLANDFLIKTSFGMHPKTFLYLFYFNFQEGLWGMNRIQGFCWEPSCWNLLLNINLVMVLYFKESKKTIVLSVLSILSIMSTTGLITMSVIFVLHLLLQAKEKKINKVIPLFLLFFILVFPLVLNDYENKMESGSGQARLGDFAIASAVLAEHPLLGDDLDNITKNVAAMRARQNVWTSKGDFEGYMKQGMVNSFAALLVEWGIPLFFVIIWMAIKSPIIKDGKLRFVYTAVFFIVLMGTPIARTGFFYMLPLSTYLMPSKK